jgi:hypothetical protein
MNVLRQNFASSEKNKRAKDWIDPLNNLINKKLINL